MKYIHSKISSIEDQLNVNAFSHIIQDTERTKYTIMEATPVDFVTDGQQLANEIDSYLNTI